jgi:FkbM family methyltransferase
MHLISPTLSAFGWSLQPECIRELVHKPDPLLLEIGAWEGDDTVRLLDAIPGARMLVFEPDPRPYSVLYSRLDTDSRVALLPLAVGAATGTVTWYQSHGDLNSELCRNHDWSLSSSLKKPEHHLVRSPNITFTETTVQCVRLDDWLGTYPCVPTIDFAWIDAQGAQHDIIVGGSQTLNKVRYIYIELHVTPEYAGEPKFKELCELLPAHEPMAQYDENILFKLR